MPIHNLEDWVPLPVLTADTTNLTPQNGSYTSGFERGRCVVTAVAENPALVCAWLDQMYDPFQSPQNNWGTYGEDDDFDIFELGENEDGETMRHNKVAYKDVTVTDAVRLEGIKGRRIDMELNVRAADLSDIYHKFAVRFAQDEECYTSICFRPRDSVLKVDRKFSGTRRAIIHQRRSKVSSENGSIKLRLILDRFSAEVFANDGEHVMTITLYTPQEAEGIYFYAEGKAVVDVVKYDLI